MEDRHGPADPRAEVISGGVETVAKFPEVTFRGIEAPRYPAHGAADNLLRIARRSGTPP